MLQRILQSLKHDNCKNKNTKNNVQCVFYIESTKMQPSFLYYELYSN